ncbi:hypothetical protein JCM10213_002930 [Rhodosporidiobolus nylandii]
MLGRPHTPTPRVEPQSIQSLLGWGLVANVLLPHAGFAIQGVNAVEDGPPVWPAWLEPWYAMICPVAWELLQPDDELDEAVILALVAYYWAREQAGAEQDELDDIARQTRKLRDRRSERWARVYALHGVRQRFLAYYSKREAGLTADEIVRLHAAQVEDAPPPPPADLQMTIWPLDLPHSPPRAPSTSASAGRPCNCLFGDEPSRAPVYIPDVPTRESDQYFFEWRGTRRGQPVVDHVGAAKKGNE